MKVITLTTNEADLLRAIVANRLEGLVSDVNDITVTQSNRLGSADHMGRVAELLIALDNQEDDDGS